MRKLKLLGEWNVAINGGSNSRIQSARNSLTAKRIRSLSLSVSPSTISFRIHANGTTVNLSRFTFRCLSISLIEYIYQSRRIYSLSVSTIALNDNCVTSQTVISAPISKWAFSSLIYFYSNSPLNSPYVWMWFLVSTVGFIIFDRSDPLTPFHSLRSHIRLVIPFPQLTTTNQFNFPELILVFAHLPLSHSIFNKFQILQLTYFISRQFHFNSMESYVLFFRYLNSLSVSLN